MTNPNESLPTESTHQDPPCGTCGGSGKWPEFAPDDVDCMACGGEGVTKAAANSEAGHDEGFLDLEDESWMGAALDSSFEGDQHHDA